MSARWKIDQIADTVLELVPRGLERRLDVGILVLDQLTAATPRRARVRLEDARSDATAAMAGAVVGVGEVALVPEHRVGVAERIADVPVEGKAVLRGEILALHEQRGSGTVDRPAVEPVTVGGKGRAGSGRRTAPGPLGARRTWRIAHARECRAVRRMTLGCLSRN